MKILLSAFNCNPHKGSEEAWGWAWAEGLSQIGHEVWVITKADNQPSIKAEMSAKPRSNLHFFYCEFSPPSTSWLLFEGYRFGMLNQTINAEWRLFWWQWGAYKLAKYLSQQVEFDFIHHVTNSCIRRYSFMGFLGIPFILGPLAGGVTVPWHLRKSYPFMGKLRDLLRDLANFLIHFNPLIHLTFDRASKIYCDSKETQACIPQFYRTKSEILFYIPTPEIPDISDVIKQKSQEKEVLRVLFVGRLLYWKGLHLALKAFAQLHQKIPDSRFTIIGSGTDEKWLQQLAARLNISNFVDWVPWIEQKEVFQAYLKHDVFLIPTLHDTGPNVILEAFYSALPVVSLDLGGSGVMVDETCGRVIKTEGCSEEKVIQGLSNALIELATNPTLRYKLSEGALARTSKFMWRDILEKVYPSSSIC